MNSTDKCLALLEQEPSTPILKPKDWTLFRRFVRYLVACEYYYPERAIAKAMLSFNHRHKFDLFSKEQITDWWY
jgi:hypothetical protein